MQNIYAKVLKGSGVDFGAVRDGRNTTLSHFDVDLSVARSIAAGSHLVLNVAGDALVSDLDPVNQGVAVVYVQDTNLTSPGSPVYFPPGAILKAPYTQILIENAAQAGKRLRIFYGVGIDFSAGASGNVNVSGSVSTIDGEASRTLAGIQFVAGIQQAATAAVNSYCQLWNPLGSGKNLIVQQVSFSVSVAMSLYLGWQNAALATNNPTAISNKLQSSVYTGVGQARTATSAAGPATAFWVNSASPGSPILWTPKGGLIVPPGQGLTVGTTVNNGTIFMNPEWYEG